MSRGSSIHPKDNGSRNWRGLKIQKALRNKQIHVEPNPLLSLEGPMILRTDVFQLCVSTPFQ